LEGTYGWINGGSVDVIEHDGASSYGTNRSAHCEMRRRMYMMKAEMTTAGAMTLLAAGDDEF